MSPTRFLPTTPSARMRRIAILLSHLLLWQVAIQILGLVAGFALLRWLDIVAYAQYTVAFGFVGTVSLLIDLGFGQAVVALVGDRADDESVTDSYISGARRLRNQTMILLLPVSAVPFWLITDGKGWSAATRIGLYASVAVTIVARSFADFYGLRLIMRQHHGAYLRPQVVAGVIRLAALAASRAAGVLTAVAASFVSSLLSVIPGIQYRRGETPLPASELRPREREIIAYALPLVPALVYSAFQGQITIFVAATFGSTKVIADIGALSRLAQIYGTVAIVNGLVIAPKVARAHRDKLRGLLLLSIAGATAFSATAVLVAVTFPGVLAALLGSKYGALRPEFGFYLVGTGLVFVSSVVFAINSALQYLYWWLTALLILGVTAVQVVTAATLDLSRVQDVLMFLICTGGAQLVIALLGLGYGWKHGPRRNARDITVAERGTR